MHWLRLYIIKYVRNEMIVQLEKLNDDPINELVNGNRVKLYRDNCPTFQSLYVCRGESIFFVILLAFTSQLCAVENPENVVLIGIV